MRINDMSSPKSVWRRYAASAVFRIAVEQLDGNSLRAPQKADLDPGPRRMRFLREFDAFFFQVGGDGVDSRYRKTEVIEALIGRYRRRIDAIAWADRRDEDLRPAELDVDTRLALLHRTDELRAEHPLEPLRRRFGI